MIMSAIRRWLCRIYGHPRIDMYLAEGHQHYLDKQVCRRCRLAHFKGAQGRWFYDDARISSVPGRWSAEIVAAAGCTDPMSQQEKVSILRGTRYEHGR